MHAAKFIEIVIYMLYVHMLRESFYFMTTKKKTIENVALILCVSDTSFSIHSQIAQFNFIFFPVVRQIHVIFFFELRETTAISVQRIHKIINKH